MKFINKKILLLAALLGAGGCKKSVTVPPPNNALTSASVYQSNATAISAVDGIFEQMAAFPDFCGSATDGHETIGAIMGLSADELSVVTNGGIKLNFVYQDAFNNFTNSNVPFWSNLYNTIYNANSAIEGLSASTNIT
ncbi:MAG: RagB/SusD family nutrient uptake outer membrane protein, partial [Chitinophagaceae bacterium]|nr:RagB/SusD family nutrient uptake outer membrane protein [Chitinophagaceae bacterium]